MKGASIFLFVVCLGMTILGQESYPPIAHSISEPLTIVPSAPVVQGQAPTLIEKGMSEQMVNNLIGAPDVRSYDDESKRYRHDIFWYDVIQVSVNRSWGSGGSSSREIPMAKYRARVVVYYKYNAPEKEYQVYKVVGNSAQYKYYLDQGSVPLNMMILPDHVELIEEYRKSPF